MDRNKGRLKPPIKISILEKPSNEVSYCWKACQLFSYVIIVISGIATSMAIGNVQRMFLDECVLYSNLTVERVGNTSEIYLVDKFQQWGSRDNCNYCQFLPVASVVFAGIWGTLFVMCGNGGQSSRSLPQPWRIVPPAIVFNFVFVVLSCVSVILTVEGFSVFCLSLQQSLNVSSCEDLMEFSWQHFTNATYFYDDVIIAETGSAISLAGWFLAFVILVIRCITHADFLVVAKTPVPRDTGQVESPSTVFSYCDSATCSHQTSPEKVAVIVPNLEVEPLIALTTNAETNSPLNKYKKS